MRDLADETLGVVQRRTKTQSVGVELGQQVVVIVLAPSIADSRRPSAPGAHGDDMSCFHTVPKSEHECPLPILHHTTDAGLLSVGLDALQATEAADGTVY